MSPDVTTNIIAFLTNELLGNRADLRLEPDDDLLGSGLVDSLGVTRLIRFIESAYDMQIPPSDVTIENFMTVQLIVDYLDARGIPHGTVRTDSC